MPFQLRYSAPTFEKSNVLVLYVVPLTLHVAAFMTVLLAEGQLVQVKTFINFGCTLKQPERRKDTTCENSRQSPRCAVLRERRDFFHTGEWEVLVVMSA